jgi:hypothetical protein
MTFLHWLKTEARQYPLLTAGACGAFTAWLALNLRPIVDAIAGVL